MLATEMKLFKIGIQFYSFFPLLLPIFFSKQCLSSKSLLPHKLIPRLTPFDKSSIPNAAQETPRPPHFKTFYYKQTLDHFNYAPQSYDTFDQRYIVNSQHWAPGGSILAWLGAEAPIDDDPAFAGFLTDIAPRFKALVIYIEHRFYGKSIPFGTMDDAMKNETLRGYFNSAQALADYAQVLLHVKDEYNTRKSPVIVVGGSYGGMLAAWFRLKYPHIALGALASSAPILYFDNITPQDAYFSTVSKDFREVSESCYQTIRKSWSAIDKYASTKNGLRILSRKFNLCKKLNSSDDAEVLKNHLGGMYASTAQYNAPPGYPVTKVCGGIDGQPKGTDILDRIHAGVVALRGNRTCYNIHSNYSSETDIGWGWQTCSEMVIPIGIGNDTMFVPYHFDMDQQSKACNDYYGVPPRPHWVTTYYGGHDIKSVLRTFGSNIIFSNGLRDPYSTGGVLQSISDTLPTIYTHNGSHCLDLHGANTPSDPIWLTQQREREVNIIQSWIRT
ncbi:unnamed protein product [Cuscuta epithymum]|uniref:Lysosomal Pro-X carboxypeptidase n=1 Tax=Cuscuta epithymum TaxID=186058 RepID=A0AAV0GL87_9ASTE|nr:unnamed protein product [Cuscuta epithymum]CAH9148419.1 unnamed protein product [Cuscuta epithymum]